ncbi:MFS transporter [Cohnella caldifontis]|uniref:MFS transporter n=1 Tax=Cohnella caldifontis TaxID=3027471 RepID=UPI0023EAA9DE|nr:MFS transporter [Cohnella sp. YIM B05605]
MARLIFLGSMAYLMVGLAQLVIGTVMEPMVHAYGVLYGDGGQLVMHQFLGGMTGTLAAPWLIRRFGRKVPLLSALVLIAVMQAVYAMHPPWPVMLALGPLTGLGFGLTETTVGSFVIVAAAGNANKAMSRIEVFFGAGALLMPFLGSWLIANGWWRMSFVAVSIFAAATFLAWTLLWPKILDSSSASAQAPADSASQEREIRTIRPARGTVGWTLGVCILFFLVYVGFEMSFVHYLPSLMVQTNGLSDAEASLSISLYWTAMTVGRMVAGHAADRFGGAAYLVSMCAVNAVCFLLMTGFSGVTSTLVLTAVSGLAMSGMFSIALVFANRAVPGITERTTSLLMAAGGIGGALLPKLTGWFLDRFQEDMTRWLFAAFGILLLLVIVWAAALASRSSRKNIVMEA